MDTIEVRGQLVGASSTALLVMHGAGTGWYSGPFLAMICVFSGKGLGAMRRSTSSSLSSMMSSLSEMSRKVSVFSSSFLLLPLCRLKQHAKFVELNSAI